MENVKLFRIDYRLLHWADRSFMGPKIRSGYDLDCWKYDCKG